MQADSEDANARVYLVVLSVMWGRVWCRELWECCGQGVGKLGDLVRPCIVRVILLLQRDGRRLVGGGIVVL